MSDVAGTYSLVLFSGEEVRQRAIAVATALVAKWEHGSEEHRQWLRDVAIKDIAEALLTWGARRP